MSYLNRPTYIVLPEDCGTVKHKSPNLSEPTGWGIKLSGATNMNGLGEGWDYLLPEQTDRLFDLLRGNFGEAVSSAENVETDFRVLLL